MARVLWIIPAAFFSTLIFKNKGAKIKIPYFIGLFIFAMILNTYFPFVQKYSHYLTSFAKAGLTLTLFLIECGLNQNVLQSVGFKPLIQGIVLWVAISVTSLWIIINITM